jgi:hypothetical protein
LLLPQARTPELLLRYSSEPVKLKFFKSSKSENKKNDSSTETLRSSVELISSLLKNKNFKVIKIAASDWVYQIFDKKNSPVTGFTATRFGLRGLRAQIMRKSTDRRFLGLWSNLKNFCLATLFVLALTTL